MPFFLQLSVICPSTDLHVPVARAAWLRGLDHTGNMSHQEPEALPVQCRSAGTAQRLGLTRFRRPNSFSVEFTSNFCSPLESLPS